MIDNFNDTKPMLTDQTYDFIKKLVLIVLPALATLYFTLGGIWGFPYVEQVIGTITALSTFLGVLLRLSAKSYNDSDLMFDGVMNVTAKVDGSGSKLYSIDLKNGAPAELDQKSVVVLKVNPQLDLEPGGFGE